MKHSTINMTLAVAALTLAAGTVSAQSMKARSPSHFACRRPVDVPGHGTIPARRPTPPAAI